MPLPLPLQKRLSVAVCDSQAYWRPFSTFTHETIAPARTALEMAFTHAEPRLKPLGDPFQASSAETSVHKRSHSYSGYIPYYLQPSHDELDNKARGGRCISPCGMVAASGGGGAGYAPQYWPDTDSDTEQYFWTRRSGRSLTAVPPPVWSLPLPSALTVNRVHSNLPPLSNTGYIPYFLQLPPVNCGPQRWPNTETAEKGYGWSQKNHGDGTAVVLQGADYTRDASVQRDKSVSHASASGLTSGPKQLVSAGSTRHYAGHCKPCAFVHKGECVDGILCDFCHLCTPTEKKRRQREKIKKAKEVWRLKRASFRSAAFYHPQGL